MPCASNAGGGLRRRSRPAVQVVFEQVERAGLVPLADGVDEDERVVAVEQAVGQVHAADAEVGDLDAGRQRARRRAGARPRRRTRRRRGRRCRRPPPGPCSRSRHLDLVGVEVAEPPVRDLQLGGRVAVDGHREVHLAVDVVQHGLRRSRAARRGTCPARRRPGGAAAAPGCPWRRRCRRSSTASVSGSTEASAPGSHQGTSVANTGVRRRGASGAAGPRRRGAGCGSRRAGAPRSPAASRRPRRRPRRPAGRSPAPRAFSSSVSASVRRLRISSISVPSNRSRRALRGELRVVGEDDRRGQQQVRALRAARRAPARCAGCPARRSRAAPTPAGRWPRGTPPPVTASRVCAAISDVPQRDLARGAVGAGGVVDDVARAAAARRRARAAARPRRRAARSAASSGARRGRR